MNIGERIKDRRESLGLSQEDLAKKVGYKSRSSINKIEMDGRGLPQRKIKVFADALYTTPAYLMGWEEEEEITSQFIDTLTPEEIAIIKKYRSLDDYEKWTIRVFMKIEEERYRDSKEKGDYPEPNYKKYKIRTARRTRRAGLVSVRRSSKPSRKPALEDQMNRAVTLKTKKTIQARTQEGPGK